MNAPTPTEARTAKRLLTVEEFLIVCASGVFGEGEHVELWDGEMIMSPSEGGRHFNVKAAFMEILLRSTPQGLRVGPTGPLRIDEHSLLEPDLFWFSPKGIDDIPEPEQMKLVIEVSVTSLQRDRTEKALRYAAAGIQDYWVVDAEKLIVWVHRKPSGDGFGDVREYAPTEPVSPLAAPGLAIRMGDLFSA